MNKQKVPKLRFPEFTGEWEEKKLGEICTLTSSKRIYLSDYVKEGIPFYRGKEISELKKNKKPKELLYIRKEKFLEYKYKFGSPLKNDILITAVGTLGKVFRIKNNYDFYFKDGNLIWLKNIYEKPSFLEKLLEIEKKKILKSSIGSTQKALTIIELKKIKLSFPSLPEQEKIADFLTLFDKEIELEEKKLDLLKENKKGYMQKIFNQEIRFKDEFGNNYPQWEEKKLGEITRIFDGTHQTPKYVEKGIPFYSVEHLTANQFKKTKYITEEVFKKENKRVSLEKDDILMTRIGSIGVSRVIDWNVRASFYVSLALIKSNKSCISKYLNFFIQTNLFQRELWKRTIHVAFPKKINLSEIGSCSIQIPSLPEQEKIANFLSMADEEIELMENKIEKLKEIKKGLLQQMFI